MRMYPYEKKLLAYLLMIFLITLSVNACGGKYKAVQKSMEYIKSGDLKKIDENKKRPLVIPVNGTSNHKENDSFREVYTTIEQLIYYEKTFDLALLRLYSPSAYLQNTRYYSFGNTRTVVISYKAHSELAQELIEEARNDNDYSEYYDFRFAEEGDGYVRVSAKRYSVKKGYESDISWLFGKNDSGAWIILEEISESTP